MATFSHTTLGQAKDFLAQRLGDTGNVRWHDAELGLYLVEAIRTWGVASLCFRDRGIFEGVSGTAFYDPTVLLRDHDGDLLLEKTVTDRELINSIQYHLLEPVNNFAVSSTWAGTEQFTMAEITGAIERRRNQFLLETSQILSQTKRILPSPPVDRFSLPDSTIDVKRAAWISMSGANELAYTNLWETDEFQLNQYRVNWPANPGSPMAYTLATIPETEIRLAPASNDIGKLHLITVDSGTTLNETTGVLLGILNDFTPIVKWGALADLLGKDGIARDPRTVYCEERWKEGIELAKMASIILNAEVNGLPVPISSIYDLDTAMPGWQIQTGQPTAVAIAGPNLLALYKSPTSTCSITLDVVRNAIVPSRDVDYIQVGREYLDIILDYAQHLACFKEGAAEVEQTRPHFDRMMQAAARYNERLRNNAMKFESLRERTSKDETQRGKIANAQ